MMDDYKFMQDVIGDRFVVTHDMRVIRAGKSRRKPVKIADRLQTFKQVLKLKFAR